MTTTNKIQVAIILACIAGIVGIALDWISPADTVALLVTVFVVAVPVCFGRIGGKEGGAK